MKSLFPILAALALLAGGCSSDSSMRDGSRKNESKLPPAQLAFISMKNQLSGVDWNKPIDTKAVKPTPGLVGYQIGLKVPNLTLALFTHNETASKALTTEIIELSKVIDIDDEAVLLQIKDRAGRINNLVRDSKGDNYADLITELGGIESLIKTYFHSRGNDTVIQQIIWGTWLDFLRISLEVQLGQNLNQSLPGFFSRAAEVSYFREKLKKVNGADREMDFLKKQEGYLNASSGRTLSRDEMSALLKSVNELRSRYGNP